MSEEDRIGKLVDWIDELKWDLEHLKNDKRVETEKLRAELDAERQKNANLRKAILDVLNKGDV